MKNESAILENSCWLLRMLNMELLYIPPNPLGIYSRTFKRFLHKNLYMNVRIIHNAIIYNTPKVETTHMSINLWMDKKMWDNY